MVYQRLYLVLVMVFVIFPQVVVAGPLHIGPAYADKPSKLDVVLELVPEGGGDSFSLVEKEVFLLEEGQKTIAATEIKPFKDINRKMAVVLALDMSGSMKGAPIEHMKKALRAFIEKVGPTYDLALVTFANDVQVEVSFSDPKEKLQTAIGNLVVRGTSTELHKGLFEALSLFEPIEVPLRRRLVVISDGKDEGAGYKLDDVIAKAKTLGVFVDTIGLTKNDPKYLSNLDRLAALTGGQYSRAVQSEQLQELFEKGASRLQLTPVARFLPQNIQFDGQKHKIGIQWRTSEAEIEAIFSENKTRGSNKLPWWIWLASTVTLIAGGSIFFWMVVQKRKKKLSPPVIQSPSAFPGTGGVRSSTEFDPGRQSRFGPEAYHTNPMLVGAQSTSQQESGTYLSTDENFPSVPDSKSNQGSTKPPKRKTQFRVEFSPPRVGSPSAILVGQDGFAAGIRIGIEVDPFWIGADSANTLPIEGDGHLSVNHACRRGSNGSLLVYDNHSTNGTFVNEEPLTGTAPYSLNLGDRIRVGHSILIVQKL